VQEIEKKILADLCLDRAQTYHYAESYVNAARWYEKALALGNEEAAEGMMYALVMLRQFKEAIPFCTLEMLSAKVPEKADVAHYNRGLCRLMIGDYINGFQDYDTRMRMGKTVDLLRKKIGDRPLWDNKPCKHLLVYGEQGMGDLFMFSRYIEKLGGSELAQDITFEVPASMVSFMEHNFDYVNVIAQTEQITPSDEHVLIVSLAKTFKTTISSIPSADKAYLTAEPDYIEKWGNIARLPGLKIGLCWAGRSEQEQNIQVREWNGRRSVMLKQLQTILTLPDVSFVSLQKGIDTDQLADYPFIHAPSIENWSDTAGIIHHLDLVITVDTGPAHLAGAMGKETWLLNHVHTCWRWGLEGPSTPWYNSVRVFRQEREGIWDDPIERICFGLISFLNRGRTQ
jgi:hypothetical protein